MALDVQQSLKDAALARIRRPRQRSFVSWDRAYDATVDLFTIGVSKIEEDGHIIAGEPDVVTDWDKFAYNEETAYVMGLWWERQQTEPVFSVARSILDIQLSNTGGRFTPGGGSAIDGNFKPRRPVRVSVGFDGVGNLQQAFIGESVEAPEYEENMRTVSLHCRDFLERIWNFSLEQTEMFTDKRSDELISELLQLYGLSTDQFDLDEGFNTIAFAYFKRGDKLGPIIQKIVEAELGWFYLDENGIIKFENRQGWLLRDTPVLELTDDLVISEKPPSTTNIVNVCEVTAKPRQVESSQQVYALENYLEIPTGGDTQFFADYQNPVTTFSSLSAGGVAGYDVNEASDGSGNDRSGDITFDITHFAESSLVTVTNNTGLTLYLIRLDVWGTPAKLIGGEAGIYVRYQDDTSVDDFEENPVSISNDFIQTEAFAEAIARLIVNDRKDAASYRELTIPALPWLQLGDLVTRDGIDYNILKDRRRMTPDQGFLSDLTLVQRTIVQYFTIGVSSIEESGHQIAP